MDFTGARDDGVAMASAGPYANHLHLAPDREPRQYLTTHFLQVGCPSCDPINSVKALKVVVEYGTVSSFMNNTQTIYFPP